MKFLRKFRSAEEHAEYIRTADSSNMHLAPTISLLSFGDEEKPKVGYVNADLTFKFTTEMEYEERWFSTREGGGVEGYSISTFESVSGQTSGSFVKQAYLDGQLYYVNNRFFDSLRYNASTSSQLSWDGIIVKEPGQHILQLVLDKTGVEDEFIVGNTGFMNIDELYIDDTITGLGENFIDGNVDALYIPETLNYIGNNAFGEGVNSIQIHENNLYFESINDGNGLVDKINGVLIYANKNVTEFIIPEGVKGIADGVFYYASDLVSITFPSTLEWIGEYAFYYCSGLAGELVIPDSVTSIASNAFPYCSELTSVEIGNGMTSIGDNTFYNCYGLTSLVIGSSVNSIGSGAFYYCSGLTGELVIPDSVTSIGSNAFYNCSGLTSVEIGNGVTSIGSGAFSYCSGLTSVEFGNGVTSIGSGAFQYCSSLKKITCHAVTAPSIQSYTFYGIKSGGTLYVPLGSDYSSWMSTSNNYLGRYNWTQQVMYFPTECTSLSITADDVNGRATNTKIYWTAVTNGTDLDGNPMNNITITGETISSEFPQNTSETDTVERTITFEYIGVTASTTITQGVWVSQSYTVNLNNQWQLSTSIANPDSSVYEGVYESFSNKGVDSSADIMYIDIIGYENFKFYVRSNAESTYDYVVVSNLDCPLTSGTTGGTDVKMTTSGRQNSGSAISNYTLVEFTGIDGGEHRISVMYRKDFSTSSGTDQGYVLIPKNQ